jgi:hypothetical protein
MDREENATVIDRRYRVMEHGGRLVMEDSVGGTPTGAAETTALPRKAADDCGHLNWREKNSLIRVDQA